MQQQLRSRKTYNRYFSPEVKGSTSKRFASKEKPVTNGILTSKAPKETCEVGSWNGEECGEQKGEDVKCGIQE